MKIKLSIIALLLCVFNISAFSQQGSVSFLKMPCKLLKGISERDFTIYLPPGYNSNSDKKYPVLYLLHGGGGANTDWARFANLREVADSLINHGLAKAMIIACPEANKDKMVWFNDPEWMYEDYFFKEFVPYIESHYKALTDKKDRSVAGYSMGGGASVVYGVHHPELFNAAYGMSGYMRRQPLEFLKNDPLGEWRQQNVERNNPIKAVAEGNDEQVKQWKTVRWYIDCGDDDFTFDGNIDLIKSFRTKGIQYQLRIRDGNHNWDYWRPAMAEAIKFAF